MYATNFSAGAAALSAILKFAAPMLKALSYRAGITDTHHVHKIDLPSGTAKALREIVDPDGADDVKIHSIQEGEVVGKIDAVFTGASDQITIGINVEDRALFARGAIDVALWLEQLSAKSGFYTMETYLQTRLK
jgi:4-hydroxy-tetrahydrodipicolinate reductase